MKQLIALCVVCSLGWAECVISQTRFVKKGNEVKDTKTTLIWQRCPVGQTWVEKKGCIGIMRLMNLQEATSYIQAQPLSWRIPTIEELGSLVEPSCKTPVLNATLFGKTEETGEGAIFLSTTLYLEGYESMPSLYYTIDFMRGDVDAHTKSFVGALRLVR